MVLAFNRWSTEGIVVSDMGLQRYITLAPRIVPRSGARHAGARFHKSREFIVESLINKIMSPGSKGGKHWRSSGHMTGMAAQAYNIVEKSFALVEQRTKEIGVRKVLGASVPGITLMLSREFVKWVVIANVIAAPVAYYLANHWLEDFAYHIAVSWWFFALALALTVTIALLTVSYQAGRAARSNPINSLRYE